MPVIAPFATELRCPRCRSGMRATASSALACESGHEFGLLEDILVLAEPDPGKYDARYAARYAAVWALGFETIHRGHDEALYRTLSSLVAETLAEAQGRAGVIVDAGCGVGRTSADCAALAIDARVFALDASPHMLAWARSLIQRNGPVACDLRDAGFGELTFRGRGFTNVLLVRADVIDMPLRDGCADLVLSANVIDRLAPGPEPMFRECARVLRPGGALVFCNPLNWTTEALWERYPDAASILALLEDCGFDVDTWFDGLAYRELIDPRGSFQEFTTLVAKARRR